MGKQKDIKKIRYGLISGIVSNPSSKKHTDAHFLQDVHDCFF